MLVVKHEHETVNFGGLWHSDTTYLEKPPMGSVLVARELPPYGGDTLFANMYMAYETLSDGLKDLLAPLSGVSVSNRPRVSETRQERMADSAKVTPETVLTAVHPVVRTHPETGRKALYVNGAHTIRFDGMTEAESAPCWIISSGTRCAPNLPAGSGGSPVPSPSGTIAPPSTTPSTTITASNA